MPNGITDHELGIDTAPIIYYIEKHPTYDAQVSGIFSAIKRGTITGVTSVITLSEVLVQPLRANNTSLATRYRDFLLGSYHFTCFPIDAMITELAASLRAQYSLLRTPDALQIAVAMFSGCDAFLTNDHALTCVTDIRIITLDNLAT